MDVLAAASTRGATARVWTAIRRRAAAADGYTLTELLVTMLIMGVVLGALTSLFVSGSRAQLELSNRFQAQQNARLALDKVRRELHCAKDVTGLGSSITVSLGKYCPTNPNNAAGDPTYSQFTWCVKDAGGAHPPVGASPYTLWRYAGATATCSGVGRRWADHLTRSDVFPCSAQSPGELQTLRVDLIVDVTPSTPRQRYWLQDDIALRNSRAQPAAGGSCP